MQEEMAVITLYVYVYLLLSSLSVDLCFNILQIIFLAIGPQMVLVNL